MALRPHPQVRNSKLFWAVAALAIPLCGLAVRSDTARNISRRAYSRTTSNATDARQKARRRASACRLRGNYQSAGISSLLDEVSRTFPKLGVAFTLERQKYEDRKQNNRCQQDP